MHPDQSIPEPWLSFLRDLDSAVDTEVRLDCLGGFVVTMVYGFSRPTADFDVLEIAPRDAGTSLLTVGMEGRSLHQKHNIYLDLVGVAHVPENYEERLTEIFPQVFRHLRICASAHLIPTTWPPAWRKLEQMGLARNIGQNAWTVRGDFEHILRTMQTSNDRQRVLAKHGVLLSDNRLPFEFVSLRQLTTLEGRIVAHGQDEGTDQPYLMLEGVDGKTHVLHQTEEIQSARHQGQAKINSFVRVQKQFSAGRPIIHISDVGNASQ